MTSSTIDTDSGPKRVALVPGRIRPKLLHPTGTIFTGRFTANPQSQLASVFEPPDRDGRDLRVIVRVTLTQDFAVLNRYIGLAVKIVVDDVRERCVDVLMVSAAPEGFGQVIGWPTTEVFQTFYSSLLTLKPCPDLREKPNDTPVRFGARFVGAPKEPCSFSQLRAGLAPLPLHLELVAREGNRDWFSCGSLALHHRLAADDHRLRYTPAHHIPGVNIVGLNQVRTWIYRQLQPAGSGLPPGWRTWPFS